MTTRCPHCHALVPQTPSRLLRWGAVVGAWLVILVMLVGLSLASLFAVPIVPFVVFAGASLVSASYHYAFGERICEVCGRAYELDAEPAAPVGVEAKPALAT